MRRAFGNRSELGRIRTTPISPGPMFYTIFPLFITPLSLRKAGRIVRGILCALCRFGRVVFALHAIGILRLFETKGRRKHPGVHFQSVASLATCKSQGVIASYK
jgi:hypothetical protein